jgi:hypothetical protein
VSRSAFVRKYIDCRNMHSVTQNVLNMSCKQTFSTALNPVSRFAFHSFYLSLSLTILSQMTYSLLLRRIHTYRAVPMPFPCRSHAVPLPCRSAKSLDCVFPISFTKCGRVWFTHTMPFPCHATNMPFWKRPLKATAGSRQGNGMVCVNRPL